jgi:hypothetical protein
VRIAFITLMMEAVRTSETLVYSNKTTWRYIPEGSNLQFNGLFFCLTNVLSITAKYKYTVQYPNSLSTMRTVLCGEDLPVLWPPETRSIDDEK